MAKPFTFELVSPEKLLFSGEVTMVVIPGEDGNFAAMADHAPLISTVRPGVIHVYENDNLTQEVFVSGGFAEVTQTRCTMLADSAMPRRDIDLATAQQSLLALNSESPTATDQHQKRLMEKKLAVAKAKVAAAQMA